VMKQTGGSAAPGAVNTVLKRLLDPAGEAPSTLSPPPPAPPRAPPSSTEPLPTLAPRALMARQGISDKDSREILAAARKHSPEAVTLPPIEETPEDLDPSPMAQSVAPVAPTLTSAAGKMLPIITPQPDYTPTGSPSPEPPELVPYEDFARIDLRAGVILSAARVPGKDKLVDLRVDTGDVDGPRRIVSGLALSFTPEALVGQRVIVAVNLEPRSFSKELVSHGMVLTAGPSEALVLATVPGDAKPGTKVS
jgi:methionine--tRNA ligase beta chain